MAECGCGMWMCGVRAVLFFKYLLVEFGRHGLEDLLGQTILKLLDG